VGRPLQTADAPHQTIGKAVGLAVFASDALSSTAYATQEILIILAAAAAVGGLSYAFPIAIAIVTLLAIVTISYEQTIHAYPSGGGAYIVARDNLGELPAQIAGAALLMDYVLTVSVSISSGVAQIVSAFPDLNYLRVPLAVVLVFFITVINLRGVKESGVAFAIPTYFFLGTMVATLAVAFFRYFNGDLRAVTDPPHLFAHGEELKEITLFLVLHAFASGTTALTGVEAISNGITAFKEPRSRNAGITLIWMSCILGVLFLGITFISGHIGAVPSEEETVISQLARTVVGDRKFVYLSIIGSTTLILIMAANTAFADFPRLSALVAGDGFLPRQLTYRGSRLVFSRGIVALAAIASFLIAVFDASVTHLIPLYAIGVFLSFTLSQGGMAIRWWKSGRLKPGQTKIEMGSTLHYERGWSYKMIINGFGAICTVIVMGVFAYTKFADGAWVILLLIPTLVIIFYGIHRHYQKVAQSLSLVNYGAPTRVKRNRVLVLIGGVHRGVLHAMRYARSLSEDVSALYVATDPHEAQNLQDKWSVWGDGVRLVMIDSPYRVLIEPLLEYFRKLAEARQPNEMLTIVVPHFVARHWWENLLHMNTADILRRALLNHPDIVVMEVPYHIAADALALSSEAPPRATPAAPHSTPTH
jgi:amino acid transporter